MDLVLPQPGAFRPVDGRAAPAPNEEVLSLTIKPAGFKPSSSAEKASMAPAVHDVLKHQRQFQSRAPVAPAKPVLPVEEGNDPLTEPVVPKHPRRFQALASAGPAKLTNRFSRREHPAEPAAPTLPDPAAPEVPAEAAPASPQLQLPTAVIAAIAKGEAIFKSLPPVLTSSVDGNTRKSKERRGVPPTLQERRAGPTVYDW